MTAAAAVITRPVAASPSRTAARRRARCEPLLVDARDEEDLVVHREPEHDREQHHGDEGVDRPGSTPNRPPSQPRWKIAWTITPSDAPIESRFMTAACSGISSERKTTSSSSAESATTMPMNSGSLLARTWEKSTCVAVAPPT